jgi:hypothetical protein
MLDLIDDLDRDHVSEITAFDFVQGLKDAISVHTALAEFDTEGRVDLIISVRRGSACD